jgi:pyruvate/2-oxoglutarate dehydrogenase complex dihydrolipoamide acyltransferase (E2) component
MEEGTLARWLVKEGDKVSSGDLLAEIETDKATMEFEAVDEGIVTQILVAEGTDGVKVGAVIAMIQGEDDAAPAPKAVAASTPAPVANIPAPIVSSPVNEPPAHPNCVCDISPYVVDTRNIGEDALSFILGDED